MAETKTEKKVIQKTAPKAESKPVKAKAPKVVKGDDFAIIETGGKQYGVSTGETIKIEKIKGALTKTDREDMKVGDAVVFDKVLLIDGSTVKLGAPYIAGAKVSATIAEIGRDAKVTVIKYKQKSRYFKKNGHRQPFFKVTINSIA